MKVFRENLSNARKKSFLIVNLGYFYYRKHSGGFLCLTNEKVSS